MPKTLRATENRAAASTLVTFAGGEISSTALESDTAHDDRRMVDDNLDRKPKS